MGRYLVHVVLGCALLLELVTCQAAPVVTSARVSVVDQLRVVSIQYDAEEEPLVLWKIDDFLTHMDNYTNDFDNSQGTASVTMYLDGPVQWQNSVQIVALLYANSYQVSVVFYEGDVLGSEMEINVLPRVKLSANPGGIIGFDRGDTVEIEVSLESPDLTELNLAYFSGDKTAYDNDFFPPSMAVGRAIPYRERAYWDELNVFIMSKINITDQTTTTASTTARIDTSRRYSDGEIKFYALLNFTTPKSLVEEIVLRRWVYLKDASDESPFQNQLSLYEDPLNRKRLGALNPNWPYTQIEAMGYPKPELKLFRGCTEVREPEVEIFTTGTPYRTRAYYKFNNVTDSLTGAYYMVATSGDKEITKLLYLETI